MKRYFSIDMEMMRQSNLSLQEWMILENIHFMSVQTGWCFASKKVLSKHHGLGDRGYQKARQKLTENGWLKTNKKGHLKTTKKWLELHTNSSSDANSSSANKSSDEGRTQVPTLPIKKEVKIENSVEVVKNITEKTLESWNILARDNDLAPIAKLTKTREEKLSKRAGEVKDFAKFFEAVVSKIEDSRFLLGINEQDWKVTFDWLIQNDTNMMKVFEGVYNDRD